MNPLAKSAITEGIFPQTRDIPADVTTPNFVPDVETRVTRQPELVIQWGGRGDDIVKPITNAGMTTMLILYGTEAYARRYMTMAASAIGRPDRVGPIVEWRDRVQRDVEVRAAAIPAGGGPKVLNLQRALDGLLAAGEVYNDFCIPLVGGANAAA